MIVLKEREVCPFISNCPYSNDCQGTNPVRKNMFTCEYASSSGIIESGKSRTMLDQTGKMKILTES